MAKKRHDLSKFDVFGPFKLPRRKYKSGTKKSKYRRTIDFDQRNEFWKNIDKKCDGLSQAVGCYIFCLGRIPWYVGKTEKLRFEKETWQNHKMKHYKKALDGKKRANPILYLIAKRTPSGRFSKASKSGHRDIAFLETLMIGAALQRNKQLLNKRDTKNLRTIHVPGFLNGIRGRRSELPKVFGFE